MNKLKIYENIALDHEQIQSKLDLDDIFTKKAPVEMEIGSGKGTFLLNQALEFKETNFIGIEWTSKYYRYAVDRLGRWGVKNVRILRTDAPVFIAEHIPDNSISGYHIYFPDPWPKARHHKRRFVCKNNLEILHKTLIPNGFVNIATDHTDYFKWMLEHIEQCKKIFEKVDYSKPAGAEQGEMAGTNFERKYIKEGRQVYTTAIKKKLSIESPG